MAATLGDADRDEIRQLIVAEQASTQAQVEALTRDFDEFVESSETEPPDDEHDPEGATIAWERMQTAALLDSAKAHLVDLADALDRLDRGDYGICSQCGEPIAVERLKARPTTLTCVACASAPSAWTMQRRG